MAQVFIMQRMKVYLKALGGFVTFAIRSTGRWTSWSLTVLGVVGLSALAVITFLLHHRWWGITCILAVIIVILFAAGYRLWLRATPELALEAEEEPHIWSRPEIGSPAPQERWCLLGIVNHSGHPVTNVSVVVQSSTAKHGGVVRGGQLELHPRGSTTATVSSSSRPLVFVKVIGQDYVEGQQPAGWRFAYGPGQPQPPDTNRIDGEADIELVVQGDGPHVTSKFHVRIDHDGFAWLDPG